jgi:hypothetical protein
MRHIIDSNMAVIIFETKNPAPSEPTDRYSYYVEYKDVADKPRESEICNGFISPDHCIHDALANLDMLDRTPEPEPEPGEPRITEKYHVHICKQACGVHRCVNPACEVKGEFVPRKVAEIICPNCGEQTGTRDFFERQRLSVATLIPLVIEQANVAYQIVTAGSATV